MELPGYGFPGSISLGGIVAYRKHCTISLDKDTVRFFENKK
jgi:hypothetical protein